MQLLIPPFNYQCKRAIRNFMASLFITFLCLSFCIIPRAFAATSIPLTINLSEAVNVTGTPRIAVDVGGITRYATYASGSGTNTLTFNYSMVAGDVDLDGVTVSSPIDLNGGTIKDLSGNDLSPLTYTVPNTSNVKVNYPSLGMDFIYDSDGRYTLNGTVYNDLASLLSAAGGSFSRNSTATYFDSTGTLQSASANTPRFDYDPVTHAAKGIMFEENRTNYIKNSQFSGFTTATYTTSQTIGNWQLNFNGPFVAQSGTITPYTTNGISTLDMRIQASNSSGSTKYATFNPVLTDSMAVSNGTQTVASAWFGVSAYSSSGGTCTAIFENRSMTSAGAYITSQITSLTSTSTYQKRTSGVITHGATAAYAAAWAYIVIPNGATCDITMQFGAPQIEQGAYATSYIPTGASATATRPADVLTIPTGSWYNQSAGSFYDNIQWASVSGVNYPMFFRVDDAINNNRWNLFYKQSTSNIGMDAFTSSVGQGSFFSAATSTSGTMKVAGAQALNNTNIAFDGASQTLDTSWTPPTVTRLYISGGGSTANTWHKVLKYYPLRVSDTQLQLMTQ